MLSALGITLPAWVVELVAVLALAGGVVLYLEHRGASDELSKLKQSSAQLVAKRNKQIDDEIKAHTKDNTVNQEKLKNANDAVDGLTAELAQRVSDFDSYRRSHPDVPRPQGRPVTTVNGECGAVSCGDLASQLAKAGNELAGAAGRAGNALEACQRDRDSLTGAPR